jgi:hypothetical protein
MKQFFLIEDNSLCLNSRNKMYSLLRQKHNNITQLLVFCYGNMFRSLLDHLQANVRK